MTPVRFALAFTAAFVVTFLALPAKAQHHVNTRNGVRVWTPVPPVPPVPTVPRELGQTTFAPTTILILPQEPERREFLPHWHTRPHGRR